MTGRHECPRTRGMIDRLVAGSVLDDDRRHAAACSSCGPVFARAAEFDAELERSAQQLIAEDLPRGILDPGLSREVHVVPRMPALAPGVTAGVAALALIVVVATGIRPVLLPNTSATDRPFAVEATVEAPPSDTSLWTLNELTTVLAEDLAYECAAGDAPPTAGAATTTVCTAPPEVGPFTAAVMVDASETGTVARVTITAEIVGAPTERARDAVATALAKVTARAFIGRGPGIRAANFVFDKASRLSGPAWAMGIPEGDVWVDLRWLEEGGYIVRLSVAS
jgi:hypothetical protein